ncbi:MAG: hypothetical protein ACQESR_17110 [Planctomycetota bacterium]
MQAFMIFRGDKPLVWTTDADTEAHTGVAECFFSFPTRESTNHVLAAVPAFFNMDEEDAEVLSVREIDIPG